MTSVGFDTNGDGTVDETVSYSYDAGGLRTQMTLPGSKTIAYSYDATGRLIGLTAWDDQHSDFHYDKVGRHVATQRPNGLSSDYAYDPASRLRRVRHRAGSSLRGQFNYTVDGRGNRTRAFERLAQSTTVSATYNKSASQVTFTTGTWTDAGDFKQTAQFSGQMQIAYTGDEALLTIGTGPDHGRFDLYINGRYWRRFDAYTAQPGERVLHLPQVPTPPGETSGTLEIRNHSDRHRRSTGYVFRFKQLAIIDTTYTDTTIDYTYDALSRLTQADYDDGTTVYDYAYDPAGNLTNMNGATRTYNATNQLTNDGTNVLTYDPNGNLTNDGTNTYTWDRANRLKSLGTTTYSYDGLGNRVQQNTLKYILDLQPGLTKVIGDSDGNRYVHSPRGIHAMQNNTGAWQYTTQDGLGSVRSLIDSTLGVDTTQSYNPYGVPDGNYGTGFAFTGEQTDANGQLYLRARYYNPSLGVFPSLDPFEGTMQRPMSLNGYAWVEGNVINLTDANGLNPSNECRQHCQSTKVGEVEQTACIQYCEVVNLIGLSCPVGTLWDCEGVNNLDLLRDDFLASARRHNATSDLTDEEFAALIANVIAGERRISRVQTQDNPNQRSDNRREDMAAELGCIVSGEFIRDAIDRRDVGLLAGYLTNMNIPQASDGLTDTFVLASVGIGNVKLNKARNVWMGQACTDFTSDTCLSVDVSPLQIDTRRGTVNLDNPLVESFREPGMILSVKLPLSDTEAYVNIRGQLLDDKKSIEYVAAILETGALRAAQIGLDASAYNAVLWYIASAQTAEELARTWNRFGKDPRGHADLMISEIPSTLTILTHP